MKALNKEFLLLNTTKHGILNEVRNKRGKTEEHEIGVKKSEEHRKTASDCVTCPHTCTHVTLS